MNSSSTKTPLQKKMDWPIWLQVLLGLTLIGLIYYGAINAHLYVSAWDEEDSSFFKNSMDSLHLLQINPSGTTLVLFWDKDCQECLINFELLEDLPGHVRIYGVHLSIDEAKKHTISQIWSRHAPTHAPLLIDKTDLLKTSFRVRGLPSSFIILPKEKKIYSHIGLLKRSQRQMLKILKRQ